MGQIQSVEDVINFLWRRRWLIGLVALVGTILAAVYAKSRPDLYEAHAAIQVQSAQVGGAEGGGSAQLLQSIEQRLTTREALLAVIERHGLYTDMPNLTPDEKVVFLRGMVSFQGIAAAGNAQFGAPAQISAILITGRDGAADKAARIANDFAQGVLDLSSTGAIDRATDTTAFFAEEAGRLSAEVSRLESEIAAYRNTHADALPEGAQQMRSELLELDAEIRALDQDLVALLQEQSALAAQGNRRATEERRLQAIDGEVAVLTGQKAALTDRRAEVSGALARVPEVERVLAGFTRDLLQAQEGLRAAAARQAEAEIALRLAERQQGERFALLDRAIEPQWPVTSGGRKYVMAGAVASLLAGMALGLMLDLMRPVVRTTAQMERQMGLRPVIALPEYDFRRSRRPAPVARQLADLRDKALALPTFLLISGGLTAVFLLAAALV
jgi:tyrosine-protein kinase Etk/Wzc